MVSGTDGDSSSRSATRFVLVSNNRASKFGCRCMWGGWRGAQQCLPSGAPPAGRTAFRTSRSSHATSTTCRSSTQASRLTLVPPSLTRSLARSLTHSLPHSLTYSCACACHLIVGLFDYSLLFSCIWFELFGCPAQVSRSQNAVSAVLCPSACWLHLR